MEALLNTRAMEEGYWSRLEGFVGAALCVSLCCAVFVCLLSSIPGVGRPILCVSRVGTPPARE